MTSVPGTADSESAVPEIPFLEPLQWSSPGSAVLDIIKAPANTNNALAEPQASPRNALDHSAVVVSAHLFSPLPSFISFATADTVSLRSLFYMNAMHAACARNDLGATN